jgi:sortase (surface protein transpeptidase)
MSLVPAVARHREAEGRHREAGGRHAARYRPGATAVRVALAAVALVAGVLALVLPSPGTPAPSAAEIPVPLSVTAGRADTEVPAPAGVRVPAIGMDSALVLLGVDAERRLVPPEDFGTAGWFAEGPVPGAPGPAVIAGHVDSYEGPAVFSRLHELTPGDEVLVDRADGSTARFEVRSVQRYPKDAFPTERVYGPTPRSELRLITCGGAFDTGARSYEDNVVVSAVLAG